MPPQVVVTLPVPAWSVGEGAPTAMKIAGIAGLLSVALALAGGIIDQMWQFPPTSASSAEIAAYADAHHSALLTATLITAFAVSLWLVFGAGVWVRLRTALDPEDVLLSSCFALALASFVTML